MRGILLLAWRYVLFTKLRSILLVSALTLTIALPLAARWTIQRFEAEAIARSQATPLVVGAKGSRFSLAIHAIYFRGEELPSIRQSEAERIRATGLATTIPMFLKFRAQGFPIVATTEDYLDFRHLRLQAGDPLQRLGDCLIGSHVAATTGVRPGDHLLSDPDNAFDLAAPPPLNMRVVGILAPTQSADDEAVFCSLRTGWILQGLGHGHFLKESELASQDSSDAHQHSASKENLSQYSEVTDDNLASFHFHGSSTEFPLTAILALPDSEKSETLLLGKYLSIDEPCQVIRPADVIAEMLEMIHQVKKLFDLGSLLLLLVTILLIALVMLLSIRLREREIRTMKLLGCSRIRMIAIIASELGILLLLSSGLATLLAFAVSYMAPWASNILY